MITESKRIKTCYREINSFFEYVDLPGARKYLQTSLMAANSKKIWKGRTPADLVYFYENYTKLYNAATHLTIGGCRRQSAIIDTDINVTDCSNASLYCLQCDTVESRLYVPVYLSSKEFCNPYKVFKKAVRFIEKINEKEDLFNSIIMHALSNESFTESCVEWDVLTVNIMLQKILEASHLLYVRACTNDDKWYYYPAKPEQDNDNIITTTEGII